MLISHELFAERDFENCLLKPTIGPAKALHAFFARHGVSYQAMPLENGSGLVVPCKEGDKLLLSCEAVQVLRDRCRLSDNEFTGQRAQFENDIWHWQNEVRKLMQIYHSTVDFKIKKVIKILLSKASLYSKPIDR